jgi:hypothetical protein
MRTRLAAREDWNAQPMCPDRIELPLDLRFTAHEYNRLVEGLIPEGMEDKRFVFLKDRTLWFHRSWVGECIYQVDLAKDQRG